MNYEVVQLILETLPVIDVDHMIFEGIESFVAI